MLFDEKPGYCSHRTIPPKEGSKQAYLMGALEVRMSKHPFVSDEVHQIVPDREAITTSFFGPFHTFHEEEVRKDFMFKMFALLSSQYLFSLLVIITFSSVKPVTEFCRTNWLMWQISGCGALILLIILTVIGQLRRIPPWNFIFISTLVTFLAAFFASIMIYYDLEVLIYAFAIETAIVVYITVLAKFAPCDVAGCPMIFCVLATVLSVFGVIASLIWLLTRFSLNDFVIAGAMVTVLTLYLLFDTQVMLDNKKMPISPNEFVKGNIHLYVDLPLLIMHLFLRCFTGCSKCCKKMNKMDANVPIITTIS